MTQKQIFDPNAAARLDSGIFGLPFSEEEAALIFLPVPWEATTSYRGGTAYGPSAILKASKQVDLFDLEVSKPYEAGLFLLPESTEIRAWNTRAKLHARKVIDAGGGAEPNTELQSAVDSVNELSERVNSTVRLEASRLLDAGKLVAVIGGDHSTPFGALEAIAEKKSSFGILHFDAHSDTRKAYEGFVWSHASIMRNILERIPQVSRLVQVGIRDFCEEEIEYCRSQEERVGIFFDYDLAQRKFEGTRWSETCREIVASLPDEVWISFDIDGLDPRFCPHTGTPVPGGMDFNEAVHLISQVVRSGRRMIGFDLTEITPNLENPNDEWDANVGARLLYKLAAWTLASQGKAKINASST